MTKNFAIAPWISYSSDALSVSGPGKTPVNASATMRATKLVITVTGSIVNANVALSNQRRFATPSVVPRRTPVPIVPLA